MSLETVEDVKKLIAKMAQACLCLPCKIETRLMCSHNTSSCRGGHTSLIAPSTNALISFSLLAILHHDDTDEWNPCVHQYCAEPCESLSICIEGVVITHLGCLTAPANLLRRRAIDPSEAATNRPRCGFCEDLEFSDYDQSTLDYRSLPIRSFLTGSMHGCAYRRLLKRSINHTSLE